MEFEHIILPNSPAICGDEWVHEHKHDYTMAEIEAQTIEVYNDQGANFKVNSQAKKGTVKEIMRGLK